jgi:alanine-synthesizing transaminase
MFQAIQIASVIAMRECGDTPTAQSKLYEERRDVVCRGLDKLGWTYDKPLASMFVWARINPAHFKPNEGTIDFCLRMMDDAEVSISPGRAFGEQGEGFVRIALVENEQRLRQAMNNLDRALNPRPPKPKKRQAATA